MPWTSRQGPSQAGRQVLLAETKGWRLFILALIMCQGPQSVSSALFPWGNSFVPSLFPSRF